jgi:hypothetical protein
MTRKNMHTLLLLIATLILAVGSITSLYWYTPMP